MPPIAGNPTLVTWERLTGAGWASEERDELISTFGFAVPTSEALLLIGAHSPDGVVEIGAGTGYWARMLHDRDVDVVAFDIAPPSPYGVDTAPCTCDVTDRWRLRAT